MSIHFIVRDTIITFRTPSGTLQFWGKSIIVEIWLDLLSETIFISSADSLNPFNEQGTHI